MANHPTMHRMSSVTQSDLAQKAAAPWFGNPALWELISMAKRLSSYLTSHRNRKISGSKLASPTTRLPSACWESFYSLSPKVFKL